MVLWFHNPSFQIASHMNRHPNRPAKAVQLLLRVEEECRRMGGKSLLTREEYLEIINRCYREIYGSEPIDEDDLPAGVG